ncbi:acireductone synthase [Aquifex aeolicus]|uniref:Enolase-phosphatase E1 n=1 Tax=Aquifex aeolicus (strain VF5) TaxID=224324 RepID=MTNC_AQUAE|nr:acireductone synthase [Aquifex aeolicus]O67786.1 RecName: Full=Enolase-phosphatase E1; AltName: Full=2,3-diketo-5-methylthio-1-phosphopentane phosphatase [Aquifex aeolicus VF5]AAC07754.1 enolase-phosphatase E-1 [Aquifex aeolicus VF5]
MVKAILLDIEGTIAPLSFVKEVMFPYSKKKLREFLEKNWEKPEIKKIVQEVEKIEGRELSLEEAVQLFSRWIDEDRKITPLKELQGHIWEEGFKSGELKAPLYEDAYEKIKEWKEKGIPVYIYSSGSVKAQNLFFGHSVYGDIRNLFSGFFDTKIGSKRERSSYEKIAKEIGLPPHEILFISDNPEELKAAKEAGMKVIQSVREGVEPSGDFEKITSFRELEI